MFTSNFNLPLLYQNQSMKEISINESINKVDNLLNRAVIDVVSQLPESATEGDMYILESNKISLFKNNTWELFEPKQNMAFFVIAKKSIAYYSNGWVFV